MHAHRTIRFITAAGNRCQEGELHFLTCTRNRFLSCRRLYLQSTTSSNQFNFNQTDHKNYHLREYGRLYEPKVIRSHHQLSKGVCNSNLTQINNFSTSASRKMDTLGLNEARFLTLDNMNPHIKTMQYAVRGPLLIRAAEIEKKLEQGEKLPFKEVIRANIGDCHAMGQKPITFIRQVLALCAYPDLLDDPRFPDDVKERAKRVLAGCKGCSVGSYSESPGIENIRKDAASYIQKRDGHPATFEDIMLCAGASEGIRAVMKLFVHQDDGKPAGVMIPIPQYPLYTASIAEYGLYPINYYMDESQNWGMGASELKRAVSEAKEHCKPRVIVIINPGNPTGQVLTRDNIVEIIKFAHAEKLVIFADEVYQDNVYAAGSKFYSFKKVMKELGAPYSGMELASFMSTSKGYMGECGLRGGYAEVINFDPNVKAMLNKSISAKLCPTVMGQAATEAVVNPPQPGEPSYDQFIKEKTQVLESLAARAKLTVDAFNSIDGVSCNISQGAMYAFPKITIPDKAVQKAKEAGVAPDAFFAMQLLDNTGVCIIPGSGFGQKPGTWHFRTTILPPVEKLTTLVNLFKNYYTKFVEEYK